MARIFISYSSKNLVLADEIRGWLVEAAHDVFLSQDIEAGIAAGDDWEKRLYERLRWADVVVCLVTTASLTSTWCVCEVSTALSRGNRLIPILAESSVHHPLLTRVQHLDLRDGVTATRSKLLAQLRIVDAGGGSGWPDDRSPFPGLRPFDTDQHRVFFGRSAEVTQLTEMLRSPAERADATVLPVVGPSGCGKSSLVRAGLLPAISAEPGWWTVAPMVPGIDPVAALARELATAHRATGRAVTIAELRRSLDHDGLAAAVDELLLAAPAPRRTRLLLVIDQFEELLTQSSATQRSRFAELLRPALRGQLQAVATIRPEFLDQLLRSPELAGVVGARTYAVRPLLRDALAEVITEPARLANIDIDADLTARLVADTDGGEALPLLAYTLEQLATGVSRGGQLLTSRYELLGGVNGALRRQADAALGEAVTAGGRSRDEVLRGLLRLVTVDEDGRPTRLRVPRVDLSDDVLAELEPFVTRRLLTTDSDVDGPFVEVAHEAFLSAWEPLATTITDNAVALRARRRIEHAAEEWTDNGRPARQLWERGQLVSALTDVGARFATSPDDQSRGVSDPARTRPWRQPGRRHLVADRVLLSPSAREFLRTSVRFDRRRRGRSTTTLATLLVLALIGAAVAFVQLSATRQQQRVATARFLTVEADATSAVDQRTALRLAEAARHLNPTSETQSALAHVLRDTRYTGTLAGHTKDVAAVAFSPHGHTLASGGDDGTVILWDVTDPGRPQRLGQPLNGGSQLVPSVAFSPDGQTLATGTFDGPIILWDVTDPSRPERVGQPLTGGSGLVATMAFTPDGHTLAAAGFNDNTVTLWDVAEPARPRPLGQPLAGHSSFVNTVAFTPDGHTLAAGSSDKTVILWDITDPARPRRIGQPLAGYTEAVVSVAFSPDGHTLATGGNDNEVVVWDVTDPAGPRRIGQPLTGHTLPVTSVAFAPDGRTLAAGSDDKTVTMWDVTNVGKPHQIGQTLAGHTAAVRSIAFSPDGRTLASASEDKTVILWDGTDPTLPQRIGQPLIGHEGFVDAVAFGSDDHTLASGSDDGQMILWDLTDPARPRQAAKSQAGGSVWSMAFDPAGHTLATGGYGSVILWDVTDPTRPQSIGQPLVGAEPADALAFTPDGRTLATGRPDNSVTLSDVTDPFRPTLFPQVLTGHTSAVLSLAFAPQGNILASGSDDGTVILWNVADPSRPQRIGPPLTGGIGSIYTVAFAPDSKTVAAGGNGDVVLWDVADPARPQQIGQPLGGHAYQVQSIAFTSDGHMLATGGYDESVILWDVTDRSRPQRIGRPLGGYADAVLSVAFAPDGRILATGTRDHTVVLWDLTDLLFVNDHAIQVACARTGGGLNREEWSRLVPGLPYEDACA